MLHGQRVPDRGEGGGLARAGRALYHDQSRVASERGDRRPLTRVQRLDRRRRDRGLGRGPGRVAAGGETGDQVGLHVEHVPGGEHADVFGCRTLT